MKKTHILGIIVIAVAIGVILSMVTDAATYADFKTAAKAEGEQFQVVGQLNKDKEIAYSPQSDANQFSFYMVDQNGNENKVVFKGAKPQDFERSEQVVITGSFEGEDFHADKILMKCPSKYQDGSNDGLTEITAEQ
ncbi:MAG: cytochrome C biogenesis protein [Flavobacteriales bacterium]|nr:cytochrome C biogenesis protein [Flavobacteriales bacterium]|tara:strand:+ start:446 stop:853 length:408 start_codon:yes stop_codon:yes gene_type:complete